MERGNVQRHRRGPRYKLEEKCKKIIKSIDITYDNLVVMETD